MFWTKFGLLVIWRNLRQTNATFCWLSFCDSIIKMVCNTSLGISRIPVSWGGLIFFRLQAGSIAKIVKVKFVLIEILQNCPVQARTRFVLPTKKRNSTSKMWEYFWSMCGLQNISMTLWKCNPKYFHCLTMRGTIFRNCILLQQKRVFASSSCVKVG